MTHPLELDLEAKDSGGITDEAANVLMQVQEWHQHKVDQVNTLVNSKDAHGIKLGETEITDPQILKGIRIGAQVALSFLGKLPFNITQAEDAADDFDEV